MPARAKSTSSRLPRRAAALAALVALAALLAAPAPAMAVEAAPSHPFLFELRGFVKEPGHIPIPPPEGELEDACGAATDSFGDIYLADYYHHRIDVFGPGHEYLTQIADPDPDGPCNLAVDSAGDLYVNNWRRDVVRFTPSQFPPTESTTYGSETTLDFPTAAGARSTGVFLDPAGGDLYVDDRTYVAVYEPSQLSQTEPEPARTIGLGTLGQGYGVAVSDFPETAGHVYVPDASTNTVKVYDPAVSLTTPVQTIDGAGTPQHGFRSLADSAVAIDHTDGHLFVADNTEAGFEFPAAAIDEFNAAGEYRGRLPARITDAEPSALALDEHGNVYATSGNSEGAVLYGFGPTLPAHLLTVKKSGEGEGTVSSEPAGIACGSACAAEYNSGEEVTLFAVPAPGSAFAGWSGAGCTGTGLCHLVPGAGAEVDAEFAPAPEPLLAPAPLAPGVGGGPSQGAAAPPAPSRAERPGKQQPASASEIVQKGGVRVAVSGRLSPTALPRRGSAPISVSIGGRISTADGSNPPQLRTLSIAINREGRFDFQGLPICAVNRIQPASSAAALAACRGSLVGEGTFTANVQFPQSSPFPSRGRVLAFNGRVGGRPAILAHVYGTEPLPTSYTLPFLIRPSKGTFGTALTTSLPQATGEWGFVTGIQMTLKRSFRYRGRSHSYLSAGCPAPRGFPSASFAFAKTSFAFAGKLTLDSVLTRSCRARG